PVHPVAGDQAFHSQPRGTEPLRQAADGVGGGLREEGHAWRCPDSLRAERDSDRLSAPGYQIPSSAFASSLAWTRGSHGGDQTKSTLTFSIPGRRPTTY